MTEDVAIDVQKITSFSKKHWEVLLIVLFILFGFYLRSYHMNFPVIGYHNMKENQYLPYTEFMYNADEFWDYFRTETYWIGHLEHGYFTQYEFPFIPWLILPLWFIFGIELWAARLVIILFSLASIPLLYLVGRKLTENRLLILTACFFFTIMPISVFFGRNVQPEAPGLFFILLGTYFFFCWREEVLANKFSYKYFLFFTLSFLLTILLKIPNGIGLVPLLFFVPYKQLFAQKKYFAYCTILFILLMSFFPLWVSFSKWVMPGAATVGTSGFGESFAEVRTNIGLTLSSSYWQEHYFGIRSFVLDNFTAWFFWLALLGIFFACFKYKTLLGRFIVGSLVSVPLYILFFADKVRGHAYYQFVFLPLVCFATAYALFVLSDSFRKILLQTSVKHTKIASSAFFSQGISLAFFLLFVFLSFSAVRQATDRVFDVIYYGEDFAGDFINKHSDPTERVFIDGVFSQSVGILWHAHRYGLDETTANLTWFMELEQTRNFRWVVLYGPGIGTIQSKPEVWEYIQNTYKIRQIGLIVDNGQYAPYYFVLEKGGSFDVDGFVANKQPYLAKTYTTTQGTFSFYALDEEH